MYDWDKSRKRKKWILAIAVMLLLAGTITIGFTVPVYTSGETLGGHLMRILPDILHIAHDTGSIKEPVQPAPTDTQVVALGSTPTSAPSPSPTGKIEVTTPESEHLQVADNDKLVDSEDKPTPPANPLAGRNVYFSGIADSIVNSNTIVWLENLEDNGEDIFMKYTISCDGEVIWTTDLIPAGKASGWQIGDTLPVGDHELMFNETPYWKNGDAYTPLTGGSNIVHFKVVQ